MPTRSARVLKAALALNLVALGVEVAVGLLAHSLALLSDAGHLFTDAVALALAWFAASQAGRAATPSKTFGYHRVGILVALLNAAALLLVVGWIAWEALQRLRHPSAVSGGLVLAAASFALAINLFITRRLRQLPRSLNIRAATLHAWGDVLASSGVIVAGIIIALTGWYPIDAIVSLLVAGVIALSAWGVAQEGVNILLEGTPAGVDPERLLTAVRGVKGVLELHDLHVWAVTSEVRALSAHLLVEDQMVSQGERVQQEVRELLAHEFGIEHTTLQLEGNACGPEAMFCVLRDGHPHVETLGSRAGT
jgi:cobalt-zinc-cadmium efflux system protein